MAKLRLSDADMNSLAAIRRALQNLNHAVRALEVAAGITKEDVQHWNTAYSWGNHAQAGYLTAETDPVFSASPAASITAPDIAAWNTAYSWGNHNLQNYVRGQYANLVIPALYGNQFKVLSNDGYNLMWIILPTG